MFFIFAALGMELFGQIGKSWKHNSYKLVALASIPHIFLRMNNDMMLWQFSPKAKRLSLWYLDETNRFELLLYPRLHGRGTLRRTGQSCALQEFWLLDVDFVSSIDWGQLEWNPQGIQICSYFIAWRRSADSYGLIGNETLCRSVLSAIILAIEQIPSGSTRGWVSCN